MITARVRGGEYNPEEPWVDAGVTSSGDLYLWCEITGPASLAGRLVRVDIPQPQVVELMKEARYAAIAVRSQPMEPASQGEPATSDSGAAGKVISAE